MTSSGRRAWTPITRAWCCVGTPDTGPGHPSDGCFAAHRSGRRHRRLEAVVDDRVAQALADTRIPNPRKVMSRYPHELSGGMKQRVMIAQALAANPELLIADEPTTALDVTIQARIVDLLAELQQRHHMAVLYISHDLSLVRRISARTAVMYAGQLVETGPADRVFRSPLHPYTRGLIGAIPSPAHRRGGLIAIEGTVPDSIDPDPGCRFAGRCPHAAPVCLRLDPRLEEHGLAEGGVLRIRRPTCARGGSDGHADRWAPMTVGAAARRRDPEAGTNVLTVRELTKHFPISEGVLQRINGHVKAVDGVQLRHPPG